MADEIAALTAPSSPSLTVTEAAAQLQQMRSRAAAAPAATPEEDTEIIDEAPKPSADAETVGEADDEVTEQDEAAPPPPPAKRKLKVGDEELDEDEVVKGYLRQKDYTQKTQTAAEKRKAAEAEEVAHRTAREQIAARLKTLDETLDQMLPKEPDWTKVREENPDDFPRLHAEWQVLKEKRAELTAERKRVDDEQQDDQRRQLAARIDVEIAKLVAVIPDLQDETKGPKLHEALVTTGREYGFTPEEVNGTVDHRLFVMLNDARLYRELKAEQKRLAEKAAKEKKAEEAVISPTLTPGAARTTQAPSHDKEFASALRDVQKTGSVADAAKAIGALRKSNKL